MYDNINIINFTLCWCGKKKIFKR